MLARGTVVLGYVPEHCPSRPVSVLPRRSPQRYTGSHSAQKCNVPDNPSAGDIRIFHERRKRAREQQIVRAESAKLHFYLIGCTSGITIARVIRDET